MADSVPAGGPEASQDDAPRQANMDDGGKGDGAVESLPRSQGTSANTAIVIPEDDGEGQSDTVRPSFEIDPDDVSGILEESGDVSGKSVPAMQTPKAYSCLRPGPTLM